MLKRHFIYITIILLLTVCSTVDKNENGIEVEKEIVSDSLIESSVIVDKEVEKTTKTFDEPIDIVALKKLTFLTVTSGVLPHSETKTLCKSSDHIFFGHYQLIDNSNDKFNFIGQLTVSVPDNAENWRYDNEYEIFSEIRLENNKIKVWKEIGVGTTEIQLKKFIGDSFNYKKGTMIYAELGDYSLNATILNDTINKLTVGKYCK